MTTHLSEHPSWGRLKQRAKSLLKAHRHKDAAVCTVLRHLHRFSHASDADILVSEVKLTEVQFALALDYGFSSWDALKRHVEEVAANFSEKATIEPQEIGDAKRNVILGLRRVDASDVTKQNEFLNSVISAMGHLGKTVSYDELACISGCAFRGCSPLHEPNPGIYWVTKDSAIIAHTFKVLGYNMTLHPRSDYETNKKLIVDSIDKGIPVLTFGGVVNCAECCVISGYDDNGEVMLGYSPFMYIECDHNEPHDSTGYFRKSKWHDGFFKDANGEILIIGEPTTPPSREEIIKESLKFAVKLIRGTASRSTNYMTGYEGHSKYAELLCEDTDDWLFLELMIVCASRIIYQDKLYAAPFLREAKTVLKSKADVLEKCAKIYDQISNSRREMTKYIAEDISMGERIKDKELRRQYAQCVLKIRDLEKSAADLLEKM
jgi:hypothetical protein